MGLFNSAKDVVGKGMDRAADAAYDARTAMNDKAIMQTEYAREFVRLCSDAFAFGWHEANGGNLSYLLNAQEARECFERLDLEAARIWCPSDFDAVELAGRLVLMSASGAHMRDMENEFMKSAGLVQIAPDGASWRVVWGFDGTRPTSELPMHLRCFAAGASRGRRVVYHAHPENCVALSTLVGADGERLTRLLQGALAEATIAFPRGVAGLGWYVPGTSELGEAVCGALETADAVLLQSHGIVCAGESLREVFGLAHTVEKAAGIRLKCGLDTPGIGEEQIAQIKQRYGL